MCPSSFVTKGREKSQRSVVLKEDDCEHWAEYFPGEARVNAWKLHSEILKKKKKQKRRIMTQGNPGIHHSSWSFSSHDGTIFANTPANGTVETNEEATVYIKDFNIGGWESVYRQTAKSCSVSVSCMTSRACEAVGAKFASGVGVHSGSVSCCCCWSLPRWCPAGVPLIFLHFSIFSIFIFHFSFSFDFRSSCQSTASGAELDMGRNVRPMM